MKRTQVEMILDHMNRFGSITTLEAFNNYGCTRLASRIHEIRRMGIIVNVETVAVKNRYEETVHVARYKLA